MLPALYFIFGLTVASASKPLVKRTPPSGKTRAEILGQLKDIEHELSQFDDIDDDGDDADDFDFVDKSQEQGEQGKAQNFSICPLSYQLVKRGAAGNICATVSGEIAAFDLPSGCTYNTSAGVSEAYHTINYGDGLPCSQQPLKPSLMHETEQANSDDPDSEVYGVNALGHIFSRPQDGSGAWKLIPGSLMHVSVGVEWVWGTNLAHQIYKCHRPCNGLWEHVPGGLVQVDVGDTEVWGVNALFQIYKRPADGSGTWQLIPGGLKHVSVGPEWVWGTNTFDQIYKCHRPCNGLWEHVPGGLMQVDVGDTEVWGVNSAFQIFKRPLDGGGWELVPGHLAHVSIGADSVWGVNINQFIYKCQRPCNGVWSWVDGLLAEDDVAWPTMR